MAEEPRTRQGFSVPYLLAFVIGFVYALAAGKALEVLVAAINHKLLVLLLLFSPLSAVVNMMLQRFGGRSIKIGLLIGASVIFGALLGYFVYSALSGGGA